MEGRAGRDTAQAGSGSSSEVQGAHPPSHARAMSSNVGGLWVVAPTHYPHPDTALFKINYLNYFVASAFHVIGHRSLQERQGCRPSPVGRRQLGVSCGAAAALGLAHFPLEPRHPMLLIKLLPSILNILVSSNQLKISSQLLGLLLFMSLSGERQREKSPL